MYSSSLNCGFGSFGVQTNRCFARLFTAKDYPSIEVPSLRPCIRWQVAEGHRAGNGGCNCGGKLPSRGEGEADLENSEPERWCPLC